MGLEPNLVITNLIAAVLKIISRREYNAEVDGL